MSWEYLALRVCERFGMDPDRWDAFGKKKQAQLLAYEEVRWAEEARDRAPR